MRRFVSYFMSRVQLLTMHGVVPLIIFDGGRLPIKGEEEEARRRWGARAGLGTAQAPRSSGLLHRQGFVCALADATWQGSAAGQLARSRHSSVACSCKSRQKHGHGASPGTSQGQARGSGQGGRAPGGRKCGGGARVLPACR